MAAILAGCASAAPHVFGSYNDLAPKVDPTQGERTPQHLTVQLTRPANVAIFLVRPGDRSLLLFPSDSNQSGFIDAGSHLVETSYARQALSDTSRLIRRPGSTTPTSPRSPQGGRNPRGGFGRDSMGFAAAARGYLLIYASQEPLPYNILATRVNGISVPIDDDDALNTVTKLIREVTHTSGPWAAYATEFPK
jgi:hypothetical protein